MSSQTGFPSVDRVTSGEKTAGTETGERRFSPLDIADMAAAHAGGIGAEEEGVSVGTGFTNINFTGNAVTVSDAGSGELTVSISALDGGPAVEDDGVSVVGNASILNFTGSGVTATDATGGEVTINIPGAAAAVETKEEGVQVLAASTSLNFVGAGVTASDGGAGETDVTIPGETFTGFEVEEEGVSVNTGFVRLNFVGDWVTATDAGSNEATITIEPPAPTYRVVTASGNLLAADFDGQTTVVCNSASDIVLTVPPSLTVDGPVNIFRKGTGEVDIAAGSGVTIRSEAGNLSIDSQYNAASIFHTGTSEEYALVGKLKA